MSFIALSIMLMGLSDIIGLIKKFKKEYICHFNFERAMYKESIAFLPYITVIFNNYKNRKFIVNQGGFLFFSYSITIDFYKRQNLKWVIKKNEEDK